MSKRKPWINEDKRLDRLKNNGLDVRRGLKKKRPVNKCAHCGKFKPWHKLSWIYGRVCDDCKEGIRMALSDLEAIDG